MSDTTTRPISETLDAFDKALVPGDAALGKIARRAGRHGLLPVMTFAALLIVSPLSGVPVFSTICGLIIALAAGQLIAGRDRLWLPAFLRDRIVPSRRGRQALGHVRKVSRFLEDHAVDRLVFLATPPASRVFLGLALLYGLSMPILELLPMSSSLLALSVALIGLGLLLRDGLLLLLSTVPPIAVAVGIWLVFGG